MESFVIWEGDAKLTVTINVTNDGNLPYFGKIRSYVTEIESRWNDYSGSPYHFALLDYAVDHFILIMPKKTKTITGSFDGKLDHGNQTYPDISSDNIMIISVVNNMMPHYRVGYESTEYTQKYFARFVDQATGAIPN